MFKKKKKKEKNIKNPTIDVAILKEELKKNLIAEVNLEFIKSLETKIRKDIISEITTFNSSFIDKLKLDLKQEIENELKESIKKELLLEIKLYTNRKEKLKKRISSNHKINVNNQEKNNSTKESNIVQDKNYFSNTENVKNETFPTNNIKLSDEDLIKSFLKKTNRTEKEPSISNKNPSLKHFILDTSNIKETNVAQELTQTEFMNDDDTAFDKTQLDLLNYTNENTDDDFFEFNTIATTNVSDNNLKEKFKNFSKEQSESLKKATDELKEISIKSLEVTKEEFLKLKEKEICTKYLEKFKNLKNKI